MDRGGFDLGRAAQEVTRRRGVKKLLLVLCLCAGVVLQAAKIKTRAEADPQFSFAGVRTWAWTPDGAGDVYVARSSQDESAPVKKRVDPVITAALAREMGL